MGRGKPRICLLHHLVPPSSKVLVFESPVSDNEKAEGLIKLFFANKFFPLREHNYQYCDYSCFLLKSTLYNLLSVC